MRSGRVLVVVAAALALPAVLTQYTAFVVNLVLIYAIVVLGIIVLTGYVGEISLAQSSFLGLGAFSSGVLSSRAGLPFVVSALGAVALCVAVAVVVGAITLRLHGLYFALATLALALVADRMVFQLDWGGKSALSGVAAAPASFLGVELATDRSFYYLALAVFLAASVLTARLGRGAIGLKFRACRSAEPAVIGVGLSPMKYRVLAFAVSAALAGAGGVLYVHLLQRVQANDVGQFVGISFLIMAIVGGVRRPAGALIGAIVLEGIPELLRGVGGDVQSLVFLLSGVGLTVVIITQPEGIAGMLSRTRGWARRRFGRSRLADFRLAAGEGRP